MENEGKVFVGALILALIGVPLYFTVMRTALAPANAQIDVEVTNIKADGYRQSVTYTDGQIRDLTDLMLQYKRAKDPDEKELVANVIKLRFAAFPAAQMPSELRSFYISIRGF